MTSRHLGYSINTIARPRGASIRTGHSHVTTTHTLLSGLWTDAVPVLEAALARLNAERLVTTDCHVAFFEIVRDGDLHVNVTHAHPTKTVPGWSGPARLRAGFVHNRRFGVERIDRIARSVRAMVLAERA